MDGAEEIGPDGVANDEEARPDGVIVIASVADQTALGGARRSVSTFTFAIVTC